MYINEIISDVINEFIISNNPSDYAGNNAAPGKEDNDPMFDVNNMFPDMYNDKAYDYYGREYEIDNRYVINQIKTAYKRPNKWIRIYRAVPYVNKDVDKKINDLRKLLNYKYQYNFFPMGHKLIGQLEDNVWNENPTFTYDEMQKGVINELIKMIGELKTQRDKPFKINNGDWVTTSKEYAKMHGESNLNNNYKILTKVVKASQLYTDGNSIFEWGYVV